MSAASWRRFGCLAVVGALVFGVPAGAQSDNRLDQIKRLNRVAAQKAENDIREAIKEAAAVIKNDPTEALEILDAALHTVEKDPALAHFRGQRRQGPGRHVPRIGTAFSPSLPYSLHI